MQLSDDVEGLVSWGLACKHCGRSCLDDPPSTLHCICCRSAFCTHGQDTCTCTLHACAPCMHMTLQATQCYPKQWIGSALRCCLWHGRTSPASAAPSCASRAPCVRWLHLRTPRSQASQVCVRVFLAIAHVLTAVCCMEHGAFGGAWHACCKV